MRHLRLILRRLLCHHTWELISRHNWISTYRCGWCGKTTTRRD